MVPRAVLMKSGLVSLNTARQVNTAHQKITMNSARPMTNLSKIAHSTVKRPIHKNTTFKNSNFNQRVNTVKDKNVNIVRPKAVVNAARPKAVVNAARRKAVVNAVKGNNVNAVKALACWVWKPKTKVLDHFLKTTCASNHSKKSLIMLMNKARYKQVMAWVPKNRFSYLMYRGNPQIDLQDKGVIDSGCSRYMTVNMSYLINYEEINGGYVAFRGTDTPYLLDGYSVLRQNQLILLRLPKYYVRRIVDVDTAYSSKSGNGLLIRQSLGYVV
ncbi:hypothetical protein Tco_0939986 [Tanacetum coccineum]|uniref:Uncharacterized protein n=1 Tax=Tanacetum coccineum TaxID=301880 RepID=A0ABQ5DLP0_9ASTR